MPQRAYIVQTGDSLQHGRLQRGDHGLHQQYALGAGGLYEGGDLRFVAGKRLFAKHVLACPNCCHGIGEVGGVGRPYIDGVHLRTGGHRFD